MKHYDLIVAGGGLTGVAAAVSAARDGLSVLLIEKSGCLGSIWERCGSGLRIKEQRYEKRRLSASLLLEL